MRSKIIVDIQGEGSGPLFGSKYHYKMTATNVPSLQMTLENFDPFCREGLGQCYKMGGPRSLIATKWYAMQKSGTHLVVTMNAYENHQRQSTHQQDPGTPTKFHHILPAYKMLASQPQGSCDQTPSK